MASNMINNLPINYSLAIQEIKRSFEYPKSEEHFVYNLSNYKIVELGNTLSRFGFKQKILRDHNILSKFAHIDKWFINADLNYSIWRGLNNYHAIKIRLSRQMMNDLQYDYSHKLCKMIIDYLWDWEIPAYYQHSMYGNFIFTGNWTDKPIHKILEQKNKYI